MPAPLPAPVALMVIVPGPFVIDIFVPAVSPEPTGGAPVEPINTCPLARGTETSVLGLPAYRAASVVSPVRETVSVLVPVLSTTIFPEPSKFIFPFVGKVGIHHYR